MIRVAVIGLGKMGMSHVAIVRSHPGMELVAVCDTSQYVLNFLSTYTGLKTYSDADALLSQEQLDAVIIATPSRFHGDMVRKALARNLHVFCEKPFCLDLAEGRQLADEADKKKLVNQVGYHFRFVAAFKEARRLVQEGILGKLHHIRAEAYGPVVLKPKGFTWRSSKEEGGGCLYDYASHAIDLVNYLYRAPARVEGTVLGKVFSTDVDDQVYTTLHFSEGATGQLAANWSDESFRKMSTQVTFWGSNGRLRVDRQELQIYLNNVSDVAPALVKGWNTIYTTELTEPVWYYLRGEEYSSQIDHFVQSIAAGVPSISSFRTALEADTVISKMLADASGAAARPQAEAQRPSGRLGQALFGKFGKVSQQQRV